MPTYGITGASGQLGRLAVQELLARGIPAGDVVAVVRTPSRAADLADRGVRVREADYASPRALDAALDGVDRLLLISSSEAGQRVAHHTNVIQAAKTAGTTRIAYTSMLNADHTINPLASEHQDSERALCAAGVPFTLLRNGWYTENYTDQLGQYLQHGEILGAAGRGRISAATRQDYAAAAAAALLKDDDGNRTYELGGPAFDLPELARVISEVTGTPVTYTDLSVDDYAARLERTGLDEASARFVAALDASIANGDLETDSRDLEQLLAHSITPLVDAVRAAADVSSSQLYHYFDDKAALVSAVIEHQTDAIVSNHERLDLSTLEGLRAWRDWVVDYQRSIDYRGGCPIGSLGSELADTDPEARAQVAEGFKRWETAIQSGLREMHAHGRLAPDADPDSLALALLTALQGGLLLARSNGTPNRFKPHSTRYSNWSLDSATQPPRRHPSDRGSVSRSEPRCRHRRPARTRG